MQKAAFQQLSDLHNKCLLMKNTFYEFLIYVSLAAFQPFQLIGMVKENEKHLSLDVAQLRRYFVRLLTRARIITEALMLISQTYKRPTSMRART